MRKIKLKKKLKGETVQGTSVHLKYLQAGKLDSITLVEKKKIGLPLS